MFPGFTGVVALVPPAGGPVPMHPPHLSAPRAVTLADAPWSKSGGSGGHDEPGTHVNCRSETTCAGVVRLCRTWCDNGSDSGWKSCGGCVGIGGVSLDLW
jgi:hypothetical protein